MRAFCDICRIELWAFPGVCEQCVRSGLGFDVGFYLARDEEVIMGAWVLLALLMGAANLTRHRHIGDTRTLSRLRQDGWLGVTLLALALTGCAAADVAVGAAVTDYALGEVAHEVAHACDCDSTKGPWASCQNGAGLCCRTCGKVCAVLESKPPRWQGELVRGVVKACEGADACEYYWCPQHPCPEVLDMGTDGGVK